MKRMFAWVVPLGLFVTAGAARAQNATPWDGVYLGASLGDESTKVCSTATLSGTGIGPTPTSFSGCSSSGFVGGLQFGENFQIKRFVWGIGADVVFSEAKNDDTTLKFAGAAPPPGTYSFRASLVRKISRLSVRALATGEPFYFRISEQAPSLQDHRTARSHIRRWEQPRPLRRLAAARVSIHRDGRQGAA